LAACRTLAARASPFPPVTVTLFQAERVSVRRGQLLQVVRGKAKKSCGSNNEMRERPRSDVALRKCVVTTAGTHFWSPVFLRKGGVSHTADDQQLLSLPLRWPLQAETLSHTLPVLPLLPREGSLLKNRQATCLVQATTGVPVRDWGEPYATVFF